ncbi:MAG: hypothetical protein V3V41_02705, partial [Candidatus Heimdallarchaeota archaeon]
MQRIAKWIFNSLYILAILSLITPLTLNNMVKNDIMWSKSSEVEFDYFREFGYDVRIRYIRKILMNNSNQYYGI